MMVCAHYVNKSLLYTAIFMAVLIDSITITRLCNILQFFTTVKTEAVLASTRNLCFRAKKLENNVYPCKP